MKKVLCSKEESCAQASHSSGQIITHVVLLFQCLPSGSFALGKSTLFVFLMQVAGILSLFTFQHGCLVYSAFCYVPHR